MVFFLSRVFLRPPKHPLIARLKTPEIIHSKNMLFVHMPKIDQWWQVNNTQYMKKET